MKRSKKGNRLVPPTPGIYSLVKDIPYISQSRANAKIVSSFPLLCDDEHAAILNATKVFAAPGSGKYIAWNKKVDRYRSQRLKTREEYNTVAPLSKDQAFTWPMLLEAAELGDEFNVRTLLQKNCVLPPETKTLNAAIVRAARKGHSKIINMLLNYGYCSPDAHDEIDERAKFSNRKFVALLEAAVGGHETAVSALLDRGADPHVRGSFQRNALHYAAEGGHNKCLRKITSWILADGWEKEINEPDEHGRRPIHMAADGGHVEPTLTLLYYGANVDSQALDESTPLLLACKKGWTPLAKTLLEHDADPYLADQSGETPFMWALFKKHQDIIDVLLPFQIQRSARSSGGELAPVHAKNKAGDTCLITAVKYNYLEVAKTLLKHGANIDDANKNGDTALHWAARNGLFDISAFLLSAGADLTLINKNGMTAFEIAAENSKSFEFVMLFLKGGEEAEADGFEFKRRSELGLLCAALYGRTKVVQKLIDQVRVDRNCLDAHGNNTLHLAAKNGHDETVRLLLRRGVSRLVQNKHGEKAVDTAKKMGQLKTVEILCTPFGAI